MYEILNTEVLESKQFKGDIIITDPCYICKKSNDDNDDWDKSEYGYRLDKLGIHNFMTEDTIYGDWGCHTYNKDTEEVIGQFCADAGLVTVCLLDEVLAYNPDFKQDYIENRPWTVTVVPNFDGTVSFVKRHIKFTPDKDSIQAANDTWEDVELVVEGNGNINFIGQQTSL